MAYCKRIHIKEVICSLFLLYGDLPDIHKHYLSKQIEFSYIRITWHLVLNTYNTLCSLFLEKWSKINLTWRIFIFWIHLELLRFHSPNLSNNVYSIRTTWILWWRWAWHFRGNFTSYNDLAILAKIPLLLENLR